ncbi:hypothetical protein SO802_024603 [Lithocarpus litseifolius]|uniref:Uncharacterized protein n=1 Tax=Lithocarpus litseifolius TaxID=425828 RepID=A0AAW2CD28_9ROSI
MNLTTTTNQNPPEHNQQKPISQPTKKPEHNHADVHESDLTTTKPPKHNPISVVGLVEARGGIRFLIKSDRPTHGLGWKHGSVWWDWWRGQREIEERKGREWWMSAGESETGIKWRRVGIKNNFLLYHLATVGC